MSHPVANNSHQNNDTRDHSLHCITYIVSRHCFPRVRVSSLGAKWLDTLSRSPRTTPVPPPSRGDVPVFRVGRLFIIIIAIADLMSKPNATTTSAVFSYYRSALLVRV